MLLRETLKPEVMDAVVMVITVAMATVGVIMHLAVIIAHLGLMSLTILMAMAVFGYPAIGVGTGGTNASGWAATGGKFSF